MQNDIVVSDTTVIRAFPSEDENKIIIQIENQHGEVLSYIKIDPEKASCFADGLSVYVALMKSNHSGKNRSIGSLTSSSYLC